MLEAKEEGAARATAARALRSRRAETEAQLQRIDAALVGVAEPTVANPKVALVG